MVVDVIGSSCTWFSRNNTSFLIDKKIIFDVPEGNYKDIIKKMDILDASAIIITHFHTDHFLDFHIIATRFMREAKNKDRKFKVYGPKGLLDKLIALNKLLLGGSDECVAENYLEKIEFVDLYDGLKFKVDDYKIETFLMNHGKVESYGFLFTDKSGKKVGFSADTCVCENLHKILKKSDFAFVEMSAIKPSTTHVNCNEFVELTKKYPNCKMFAVHTPDVCLEFAKQNGLNFVFDGQEIDI